MALARCHSAETGWTEIEDLSKISDLRVESGNLLWVEFDVKNLDSGDVPLIAEEFELPIEVVEDAVNLRQRPKLDTHGEVILVVIHQLDEIDDQLEISQIATFIGPRFVLVLHAGAERTLSEAKHRWETLFDQNEGSTGLLHTLADVVVDDYQNHSDRLEDEMENLEEIALQAPNAPIGKQLYGVKQQVARLRRFVVPAARVLDWALDPDPRSRPFNKDQALMFRDIHDHLMRISDQIKNIDELSQAVIDLASTEHDKALNETTRRLTAWAAIFAVGTLIAGIYGMNFRLVPKDQTLFGFWFAIFLMVVSSVGLYIYFRTKKWL